MGSDIAVALITGGLTTGGVIVGSLATLAGSRVTQRAQERRRRRESRAALIAQWRDGIRQLRNAEKGSLARNQENREKDQPEEPDPPEADPMHYDPLRRLRQELPHRAGSRVDELRGLGVQDRQGQIPDLLEQEVVHIEKKWKLPEGPV